MKPRVLVTPSLLREHPGRFREILSASGFEIVHPQEPALITPAALLAALGEASAVIAGMEPFTPDVLANSSLRVVARMGVGYDAIDVPAATANRVAVTITPGTNEWSVAEQALALLFGVYRAVAARDREARSGAWLRQPLPRLAGRTLGLVGLGRIGRAMAQRAAGLGLLVIAADPQADGEFAARHGIELRSFEQLLSEADIVSLHLPANPAAPPLIDAAALARMKPDAVLINTARGSLVDEQALAEALQAGRLFGAGLDVFHIEPLPTDSPLASLPNVVLSPHTAGLDEESVEAMAASAAESIAWLAEGRWPEGRVVNDELRGAWSWRPLT